MHFTYILGVDISKDWFDVCLMNRQFEIVFEQRVVNRSDQIMEFISNLLEQFDITEMNSIFMCVEHTGLYIQNLVRCWMTKGGELAVIPANKISRSLAGSQGWVEKTDTLDARRIGEYGIRFSDKLQSYRLKSHNLELLQRLQRQRARLLNAMNILRVPVSESENFDTASIVENIKQNQVGSIAAIETDLENIDRQMQKTIDEDPYLNRVYKLITSVPGVGPVTTFEIIIATEGFTKFSPDQAKKFARYAGVIPMKHESGTSVRKRPRNTKVANRRLKPLLTMGATSLIRGKDVIGRYYQRKILEGKHHLTVINAIRNKLILRIFAVVRNDTTYKADFEFVRN